MQRMTITGNLGQDAKINTRKTGAGNDQDYALISVATSNYEGKDGDQNPIYKTYWFDVAVFNPGLVKLLEKSGKKGAKVLVEAEIFPERKGEGENSYTDTRFRISNREGRIEIMG